MAKTKKEHKRIGERDPKRGFAHRMVANNKKRGNALSRNPLIFMVGGAGIEPATSTV